MLVKTYRNSMDEKASIRAGLRILSVCAHLGIPVKKVGSHWFMKCPVHGSDGKMQSCHFMEHAPAARDGADLWQCEKCGASGDVFTLLMMALQLNFPQAVEKAKEILGMKSERIMLSVLKTPEVRQDPKLAPVVMRDKVYKALLSLFSLGDQQKENLLRRGFTEEEIASFGYSQMRYQDGIALTKQITKVTGISSFTGIPGFYQTKNGQWACKTHNALLIPVRNVNGKIYGLRLRISAVNGERVYAWYTSLRDKNGSALSGGSSPGALLHTVRFLHSDTLWITEGEIKADRSSLALKQNFVSVPGVGNWRLIPDLAEHIKAKHVVIAYDQDSGKTAQVVAKHCKNLANALYQKGLSVHTAIWHKENGKGIDDVLNAYGSSAISLKSID
ncbi:DUF3854 domain-containing protein [Heliorestis convoluta]|uniref:DUF3854 domain-containing protein n=1 Tax=Heliorestis convoluta TaxID=356322 RepID=A0A5Q2N2Q1_9FIRM|nr:DUF3854 domain-containing protein [Heliorestis convoluta]QGG46845.1 hypothetical protein FTV88_0667 [Heliorestis convoluta]